MIMFKVGGSKVDRFKRRFSDDNSSSPCIATDNLSGLLSRENEKTGILLSKRSITPAV